MRTQIYEWNNISDSREIIESKSPAFIGWFVFIIMGLLISALLWACYGEVDIVVKAQSVVKQNRTISTVSSMLMGEVAEIKYKRGQYVEKGETLLILDMGNMLVEQDRLTEKYNKKHAELEELLAFEKEISKLEKAGETTTASLSSEDKLLKWKVSQNTIFNSKQKAQKELDHLVLLEKSVDLGKNLLPEKSVYYFRYEEFNTKKEQQHLQLEDAMDAHKQNARTNPDESSTDPVIKVQLEQQNYTNAFKLALRKEIETQQLKLDEYDLASQQLYLEINDQIIALKQQTEALLSEKEQVDISISQRTISAPMSGVVNEAQAIAEGDIIQPGNTLLTIVPDLQSGFQMDIYIQNQNIGQIIKGQAVKYNILAYPSKDNGHLKGKITWISPSLNVDLDTGNNYYLVESTLLSEPFVDKLGNELKLKEGMIAEAQIITHREKIIRLVLRKLNLHD
ncbi:HlyD family efflux transporter periplasmic adaptor subunit [Paenibacillus sp. FJAT-27812]|uniref:HlyD family efflux transporter periplasmic adaptor subunit n=1 Tax=Paenibacillus sp. FJAT-27812 TaxID=1684143 RepID=UPI0006A79493|nr:HlyD family efflux transporter periplasmic adaptor subunit [Paenibacillus sp. FJAT-27812]